MTQNMEDGKQKNIVQVYVLLAVAQDPIRHSQAVTAPAPGHGPGRRNQRLFA